jgi:hypothetical protein
MKKVLLVVAALMATFVFTGCAGSSTAETTPAPETPAVSGEGAGRCLVGAPDWVMMGGVEGEVSAIGAAPVSKAGIPFSRNMAMSAARDEMARAMNVKVNNMIKNFTQVTGIGDSETVDRVSADVSKQIASETLQGTTQKAFWISPCDEVYVLIGIDANFVKEQVKNSVASSYQNDAALWQQFQSQKAQDELSAAIESEM